MATHRPATSDPVPSQPWLLGYAELQRLLGISRREVQRMVHRGELPTPLRRGRRRLFVADEVRASILALPRHHQEQHR